VRRVGDLVREPDADLVEPGGFKESFPAPAGRLLSSRQALVAA
jgi:hypothetical protein